jgi:mono/diheme cytochrome c family protein
MRYTDLSRQLIVGLTAALVIGASAHADEPIGPKLPPKLRQLLQQEMIAVRQASLEILDALVMGQDDTVADRAQAIHDSFIMAQSMTGEQRQTLKRTLPPAFVSLDKNLHERAGALATSARSGDRARQRSEFARMLETCAACHRRFAGDRFPGFARQ